MVDIAANRDAQRDIYGAPLADVVDHCRAILGVTQGRAAALLGISAPMLSQLMTGNRIKLGNPAAVQRLQLMIELCDDVAAGRATVEAAIAQIEAARGAGDVLTGSTQRVTSRQVADVVQASFRRAAGAAEHLAVAEQIEAEHPGIARLLRVYGAGHVDEAAELLTE